MRKNPLAIAGLSLSTVVSLSASAGSGADLLFQSTASAPSVGATQAPILQTPFQLDDSFASHLFSTWKSQSGFSYELNSWVQAILQKKYTEAAHLWGLVEPKLPGSFQNTGKAAWLYVLWKLDLPQTFVDQWLKAQAQLEFEKSKDNAVLDQLLLSSFERVLSQNEVAFNSAQIETILKLDTARGMHIIDLMAFAALRNGERATAVVPMLPMGHPLKIELAQTAALWPAQKQDLGAAGKIMKTQLEPAIEAKKDPMKLSAYYLQLARLLYQAGMLDAAETYYSKIPNRAPEYLKAREEITWVFLRKGDVQKLRGELVTLKMPVFKEKFAPEVPLVRAISNLKLCYFDAVSRDFKEFLEENQKWAKQIDLALQATDIPKPLTEDAYTKKTVSMISRREAELARIAQYAEDSIRVALPAVGPQAHWIKIQEEMGKAITTAKMNLKSEYRRQWKNQRSLLSEAVRKMQFVKVEFMSQMADLKQAREQRMAQQAQSDEIKSSSASAVSPSLQNPVKPQDGEIAFRFDGLYWPDELFKLKSDAQEQCMRIRETRGNL